MQTPASRNASSFSTLIKHIRMEVRETDHSITGINLNALEFITKEIIIPLTVIYND